MQRTSFLPIPNQQTSPPRKISWSFSRTDDQVSLTVSCPRNHTLMETLTTTLFSVLQVDTIAETNRTSTSKDTILTCNPHEILSPLSNTSRRTETSLNLEDLLLDNIINDVNHSTEENGKSIASRTRSRLRSVNQSGSDATLSPQILSSPLHRKVHYAEHCNSLSSMTGDHHWSLWDQPVAGKQSGL